MKILIAIDESDNAFRAVDFVARFLSKDSNITIFSVVPDTASICEMHSPELIPYFQSQRSAFCSIEDKKKDLIKDATQRAKTKLCDSGFKDENIQIKIDTKRKGIARDIIREADSGYDLVVLGRRGISGVKEFFLGSVSNKVIQSVKNSSVLIVN